RVLHDARLRRQEPRRGQAVHRRDQQGADLRVRASRRRARDPVDLHQDRQGDRRQAQPAGVDAADQPRVDRRARRSDGPGQAGAEQAGRRRAAAMTAATATPRRAGRRAGPDLSSRAALGVLGLVGVAVVFELIPRIGWVSPLYLPPTSATLAALAREVVATAFWRALLDTVYGWALGLAISVAAGGVLGIVIGSVRGLRAVTASTIEFLRPLPSVALIPVAVLLFGSSLRAKLLLVVYASFWPILLQVIHGVADVDPVAHDTALSYGFTPWAKIRYLLLPTGLPYIVTGLRLSAAIAL